MASDLDLVKLWTYLRWRNPAPRSRIKKFQISFQNISKNLEKSSKTKTRSNLIQPEHEFTVDFTRT